MPAAERGSVSRRERAERDPCCFMILFCAFRIVPSALYTSGTGEMLRQEKILRGWFLRQRISEGHVIHGNVRRLRGDMSGQKGGVTEADRDGKEADRLGETVIPAQRREETVVIPGPVAQTVPRPVRRDAWDQQ